MHLPNHECSRFILRQLGCPFRRPPERERKLRNITERRPDDERFEDEPPDDEVFPIIPVPGRKADERIRQNLNNLTTLAVAPKELREALERMAAFQQEGELQSIPPVRSLAPNTPGFGRRPTMAVLTAIAIAASLKSSQSGSFGKGFRAVQAAELRSARGLQTLGRTSPVRGRGGLHVNAAADLRGLLGFRKKFGIGGELGFGQEFSETGF